MNYDDKGWLELMDRYRAGSLSPEEKADLELRMASDPAMRQWVEEHVEFLDLLTNYGRRGSLVQKLNQFHSEADFQTSTTREQVGQGNSRRLWPAIGIAASVAAISVVATILIVRSFDIRHDAVYKELRRNVEQIKRSQRQILEDITANKKANAKPSQYAGTGFLLTPNGYVVTNYHVIKDADSIFVENQKFGVLKSSVVKIDEQSDIAILMIEDSVFNAGRLPYKVRENEADIGENVYTLGFPKEDIVYGEGTISSSSGYRMNAQAYQVSVPVNPGNSGGPLLDAHGNLTGIISGVQTETAGATFALKSQVLLDLVSQIQTDTTLTLSKPISSPTQSRLYGVDRVNQVKKWKDYIIMVRVYNTR